MRARTIDAGRALLQLLRDILRIRPHPYVARVRGAERDADLGEQVLVLFVVVLPLILDKQRQDADHPRRGLRNRGLRLRLRLYWGRSIARWGVLLGWWRLVMSA